MKERIATVVIVWFFYFFYLFIYFTLIVSIESIEKKFSTSFNLKQEAFIDLHKMCEY